MATSAECDSVDRTIFDSGSIRIGAFRCDRDDPAFHDSGPSRNYCFVFPRTAVEIQHEHERVFVANPNVVTFYNRGQQYRRNPVSQLGDHCDWFGVDVDVARDVVRTFDPAVDDRPEMPFALTRGFTDPATYLLQRQVFDRVSAGMPADSLAIEEMTIYLLERVVRSAYMRGRARWDRPLVRKQVEAVHGAEVVLSQRWDENLQFRDLAREVGLSVFHLCRTFRRATGTTLHQYRLSLRVRHALEGICESDAPLVKIALDAGFSSHSHFTSSFHAEFGRTPSTFRSGRLQSAASCGQN